jgi:coproporphyrinogen III oxidase-like Fe-S oxidoreductase
MHARRLSCLLFGTRQVPGDLLPGLLPILFCFASWLNAGAAYIACTFLYTTAGPAECPRLLAEVSRRFDTYVSKLCQEIGLHSALNSEPLQTVFFGGGTPSLVPPALLETILAAIDQQFGIAADAEVSMEADPGTFNAQKVQEYMRLGVNRFSVGVQAFDEVRTQCQFAA